ncbi:DUF4259 domain-containing protein [Nocardia sp. NPDC050710]|uniref:DUF4259 domain-containing protein n=1 Tax=Nocardia sp. NPDC050710 TaxID=3157220 RepID=UPI0033CDFAE3
MGSWDTGPFDNDCAADWCDELERTSPDARADMIRQALAAVAEETGYLGSTRACAAIAAAALVASTVPGGEPITSVYAPDFLTEGGAVELGSDVAELAVLALDRVLDEHSEWRDLWSDAEADRQHLAFASIANLRKVLDSMDVRVDQPTLWP